MPKRCRWTAVGARCYFGVEPFALTLPASGKYVFTIFPCADWGEPGTVMILSTPE